jgi:hypothetical protein
MWFPRVVAPRMGQSQVIILDTHVVLWLTTDPAKLSDKAKSAIEDICWIIGATARVEELSLPTADGGIRRSRVVGTIW